MTAPGDDLLTIPEAAQVLRVKESTVRLLLMRDQLKAWAAEGGYPLTIDGLGNMVLRREGSEPDLPPVVIGSHLDTQPTGGKFDGVLGVLAALEGAESAVASAAGIAFWWNGSGY